jgi:hypothetical protein
MIIKLAASVGVQRDIQQLDIGGIMQLLDKPCYASI